MRQFNFYTPLCIILNLLNSERTESFSSKRTQLQGLGSHDHMWVGLLTSSAATSVVILSMNSASVPDLAASLYEDMSCRENLR